jgi:hypothetical protein
MKKIQSMNQIIYYFSEIENYIQYVIFEHTRLYLQINSFFSYPLALFIFLNK